MTVNTTLTAAKSPYIGTSTNVKSGVTLTVEPGVVIKLSGSFEINGSLKVLGTFESPVVFTSVKDDSVGGDTNGDGSATSPKAGDWAAVVFSSTGQGVIEHAAFRYGGSAASLGMLKISCPCSNQVTIEDSEFRDSKYGAIRADFSNAKIVDNLLADNPEYGITVKGGTTEITGNTIRDGGVGILFQTAENNIASLDIDGNTIEGNSGIGISVTGSPKNGWVGSASMGGNTITGNENKAIAYEPHPANVNAIPPNLDTNILSENAKNGIWVKGKLTESASWDDNGYAIVLPVNGTIDIPSGVSLDLQPGMTIKGEAGSGVTVEGTLNSDGTAETPVVFTSGKDDSAGGDTNGDASASSPSPGDWVALLFGQLGQGEVEHAIVRYGGSTATLGMLKISCPCSNQVTIEDSEFRDSKYGAIRADLSSAKIVDNLLADNPEYGITVKGGSPEIAGNTIRDGGVGILFQLAENNVASVDIDGNTIEGNSGIGISVLGSLKNSWVGSASMGGNTITGNENKAIAYEPHVAANVIPPNLDTNILSENAKNGIWVKGKLTESASWDDNGYAIVLPVNGTIDIPSGVSLDLQPGMTIKGEAGSGVTVEGTLSSSGNTESPVTFTSIKDDSIGGDTNGDGGASSPASGNWHGLVFPIAEGAEVGNLSLRYSEVAIDVQFLISMSVSDSIFVANQAAYQVEETALTDTILAALPCMPPYTAFIFSVGNTYGSSDLPPPAADLSSLLSPLIPPEYGPLFAPFIILATETNPLFGGDNTAPWSAYSCPAAKIAGVPMTPVLVL